MTQTTAIAPPVLGEIDLVDRGTSPIAVIQVSGGP
jgi:hypothetical protein